MQAQDIINSTSLPLNWHWKNTTLERCCWGLLVRVESIRVDSRIMSAETRQYALDRFDVGYVAGEFHQPGCLHFRARRVAVLGLTHLLCGIVFMEIHDALEFIRIDGNMLVDPHKYQTLIFGKSPHSGAMGDLFLMMKERVAVKLGPYFALHEKIMNRKMTGGNNART